jgi:hypothetical protein
MAQTASNNERTVSQGLVDFSGRNQNNAIALTWKSLTPSEGISFNVQRSKDATIWEDIGRVNGSDGQPASFSFIDSKPVEESMYYRLKIEHGNQVEYSSMITVKFTEKNKTLIYPNPTKNVIWIKSEEAMYQDILDLEVYNILGEKVYASKVGGDVQLDMSGYNNGYYSVKIGNQIYKVLKE